jgi:hypothetical protein
MKILLDKVTAYPPHAICPEDVRMILASVPAAWAEGIEIVRLSASRHTHVALYSWPDKKLTISSRGHTKEDTLHLVLAELAAHGLGFKRRTFQHLQARYKPEIESLAAPLVQELLPKLSQKKKWLKGTGGLTSHPRKEDGSWKTPF